MTPLSGSGLMQAFARYTDIIAMTEVWHKHLPSLVGKTFEFATCTVQYARCRTYLKPGSWHKSFLCVCYEFDGSPVSANGHKPMLYGRAYLQGRSENEFAALAQPLGAKHIPDLDMIVWPFPHDPYLPQLLELLDKTRVIRHFPYSDMPFGSESIVNIEINVVRYRPEQRCILRYEIEHGSNQDRFILYAKVFADDNGEQVFARMQRFHPVAVELGVRIARPLAYSPTVRAVWQEELIGASLTESLTAGVHQRRINAIGRCLARLHTVELPMQNVVTRADRLADARKKSRKLAHFLPELAGELKAIIARAQLEMAVLPPAQQTVIHGDLHFGQFLITNTGALALFDFDEWSRGDPAQDLADLVVDPHVNQAALGTAKTTRALTSDVAQSLLASYRHHAAWTVTDAEVAWHARIQLINKAYRAVIQQESRWRAKVSGIVALATEGIELGTNPEQEMSL